MDSWYKYYADRVCDSYFNHINKKYKRFIDEVVDSVNNSYGNMMEVGCGIGSITKAVTRLSEVAFFNPVTLLDQSADMINLTKQNLKDEQLDVRYIHKSVLDFNPIGASVVHSHGLLEHFTDSDINTIINNLRGARQVHYVPSYKYVTPSRGDERLLTPKQWRDICSPDEIIEFNDGLDLILIWE